MVVPLYNTERLLSLLHISDGFAPIKIRQNTPLQKISGRKANRRENLGGISLSSPPPYRMVWPKPCVENSQNTGILLYETSGPYSESYPLSSWNLFQVQLDEL
jgi:hypothetical protein